MNASATAPREPAPIDRQHPWLGLDSYTEELREFFEGRDEESDELFTVVNRDSLTVLFGESGLGKTSLLQAGLFPRLRRADFLPVYIRLIHSDDEQPLIAQVKEAVRREIQIHELEVPLPALDETLWEYFHRKDVDFWSADSRLLTPVLVFDQFEEVFTLGRVNAVARSRCEEFLRQLVDLAENRPPAKLRAELEADQEASDRFYLEQQFGKVILSLREDFLAELDRLRDLFPSILQNQMRLLRMDGLKAFAAVRLPGKDLIDDDVAEQVVRFVAAPSEGSQTPTSGPEPLAELEIEPALLSLACSELNRRRGAQPRITSNLRFLDVFSGMISPV